MVQVSSEKGMRVGLSMGITGDEPEPFIRLAVDLGIRDIVVCHQLHETPENGKVWKSLFDEAGLKVESWALPHYNAGMWESEVERRKGLDALAGAIEQLARLGIGMGHTFIWVSAGASEEERSRRWDCMIEMVRETCRRAADCHIRIAHHFGWTPDLIAYNTETALRFMEEVRDLHGGLLFCPGSYYSAGDDPVEAARRLGPHTFLTHIRDARKVSGECESLHLGQGLVPYRRVLSALKQSGYRGLLVPEHLGPAAGQQREEIAQAMAAGYLRALLESHQEPGGDHEP